MQLREHKGYFQQGNFYSEGKVLHIPEGQRMTLIFELNQEKTPNAETIEAMEEVEAMIKDPTLGKSYTDVEKMMKELLA